MAASFQAPRLVGSAATRTPRRAALRRRRVCCVCVESASAKVSSSSRARTRSSGRDGRAALRNGRRCTGGETVFPSGPSGASMLASGRRSDPSANVAVVHASRCLGTFAHSARTTAGGAARVDARAFLDRGVAPGPVVPSAQQSKARRALEITSAGAAISTGATLASTAAHDRRTVFAQSRDDVGDAPACTSRIKTMSMHPPAPRPPPRKLPGRLAHCAGQRRPLAILTCHRVPVAVAKHKRRRAAAGRRAPGQRHAEPLLDTRVFATMRALRPATVDLRFGDGDST